MAPLSEQEPNRMKSAQYPSFGLILILVAGCGGGSSDTVDASVPPPSDAAADAAPAWAPPVGPWYGCSDGDESGATVVVAHDHVDHSHAPGSTGVDDHRVVDKQATFPAGDWQQVFMKVQLECPADGQCDIWDRAGAITLLDDPSATTGLELARYMTPYHRGFCFVADVTDLASRLTGTKTIRSFIDTWVSNDDPQNGHGWSVTTKFLFRAGTRDASAYASEVVSVWDNQAEGKLITIGDPAQPVDGVMPKKTITIPADAKKVKLRYIVTGHGQGGGSNCAEFCQLQYKTSVGSGSVAVTPWRPDCNQNPVSPQDGTWPYARAGWCPGSYAAPQIVDITDKVTPGTEAEVAFSVVDGSGVEFVNTCRPGNGSNQDMDPNMAQNDFCTGCLAQPNQRNNCDYNYNGHTQPEGRVSVEMLIYR
jgi:hypothetical protein